MMRLPGSFYGDGEPQWRQGKTDVPAETAAEAAHARRLAVRRLRAQATSDPDADRRGQAQLKPGRASLLEAIAEAIEGCRSSGRCRNHACPECMRAQQRWFVTAAPIAFAKAFGAEARLGCVSIVPALRVSIGASLPHVCEQVTRVVNMIDKGVTGAGQAGTKYPSGLRPALLLGAIDISANDDAPSPRARTKAESVLAVRFQPHLWGIGRLSDLRAAEPSLRATFSANRHILRPVTVKPFDGDVRGYAYALKTGFVRRKVYFEAPSAEAEVVTFKRNTRADGLTAAQHAEVAILLNILADRRLYLLGAEIAEGENGTPVIRPRRSPGHLWSPTAGWSDWGP